MKTHRILFLAFILNFIALLNLYSQNTYTLVGKVIDSDTKQPIPGATIKVYDGSKGTYSSSNGKFRLPFLKGETKLKISSLGYHSVSKTVTETKDTIIIALKSAPIKIDGTNVVADISADIVMKRAIEKKEENLKKVKTFKGLLYSKLVMELGGAIMEKAEIGDNSISLSMNNKSENHSAAEYKMFVLETFSNNYQDKDKKINQSEIIQRRQTSNFQPENNLLVLSDFINFYDDRIDFISTEMVTPLSKDAHDYYNFSLVKRTVLDDRYIYVIKVEPKNDVYPLFTGTINIVENTYNIIELNLEPARKNMITFLDSIKFVERFQEFDKGVWYPAYFALNGKARVDVIKGIFDLSVDVNSTSIYSEVTVNQPLPDSIYNKQVRKITVAKFADSTKIDFWEKNSLRDISSKELEMYRKVDSIIVKKDSVESNSFNSIFDYTPEIDFNRVGSVSLGITPKINLYDAELAATGLWSFGLQKTLGSVNFKYKLPVNFSNINIYGGVFSKLETFSNDNSFALLITSGVAAIFHKDYYDYFRADGWYAGLSFRLLGFDIFANINNSRQFTEIKNTDRSIFTKEKLRDNPAITEGDYMVNNVSISTDGSYIKYLTGLDINLFVRGQYGENKDNNNTFRTLEGRIGTEINTFRTGYQRMKLELMAHAGISDNTTPIQYQFRMFTRPYLINKFGNFSSAPIGIFGGNEFFAFHAKYNLTDLWWRAIGLPLYEGRGLDLVLAASTARFFNNANEIYYTETKDDFYSELGFGFERIPTFLSNVIFLGFNAKWGIGPTASGNFGWDINVNFPF